MGREPIFLWEDEKRRESSRQAKMMDEVLEMLIQPVVSGLGYELWGIEYSAHGNRSTVRVYIDSEQGIDADDCAKVSRQIGSVMDVEDPLPENYVLEVSSPGMDRRLFCAEHFESYSGYQVKLSLKRAFDGRKRFAGLLCGMEEGEVVLRIDDEEFLFPMEEIDRATVVPNF